MLKHFRLLAPALFLAGCSSAPAPDYVAMTGMDQHPA